MHANATTPMEPDEDADFLARVWNKEVQETFQSISALVRAARTFCCETPPRLGQPYSRIGTINKDAFIPMNRARGFDLELPYGDWEAAVADVIRAAKETGRKMAAELDREMAGRVMAAAGQPEIGKQTKTGLMRAAEKLDRAGAPLSGRWMLLPEYTDVTGLLTRQTDAARAPGPSQRPCFTPVVCRGCKGAWAGHPVALSFVWGFSPPSLIFLPQRQTLGIMGQMVYGLALHRPCALVRVW